MIRPAMYSDIPALTARIIEFFSGVELSDVGLIPDQDTIEFFVQDCIDLESHLFLVAEEDGQIVGGIVGCVGTWEFNANTICLFEKGWFIPVEFRRKYARAAMGLKREFYKWGKDQGCTVLCMVSTVREESPRVIKLYDHEGLKLIDHNMVRRL